MNSTITPFAPIPSTKLVTQARLPGAGQLMLPRISPHHPAVDAMMDFSRIPPASVCEQTDVAIVNQRMLDRGVQMMLVVGGDKVVTGVVTADEVVNARRSSAPEGVPVRDIMTPYAELEVVQMRNVLCSQVGNIVSALERSRRKYALVVEVADDGRGFAVRGAFIAAQIEARLAPAVGSMAA